MLYLRHKTEAINNTVPFDVGFEDNATGMQVYPPCMSHISVPFGKFFASKIKSPQINPFNFEIF